MTADESFKAFYIFHQHAMLEPNTQIAGVVVILDFEGLSMKQVVAITPSYAMRLLEFIQVRYCKWYLILLLGKQLKVKSIDTAPVIEAVMLWTSDR